jgi:hypothetical protein
MILNISTITLRRNSTIVWETKNIVLQQGEPGYDTTLKKLKIGDGSTPWNDLRYITDTFYIDNGSITNDKLALDSVTNSNLAETISVSNGGTGVTSFANTSAYIKSGATTTEALTSQVGIPGTDILGYMSPNYIINGAFDIWQRGTSFTDVNIYTADRWYSPGSGTVTVSQETTNLPSGFINGIKFVTGAASSFSQFNQALEAVHVIPLRGQVVTASGWVKIAGPYTGNWSFDAKYSTTSDVYAGQNTQVSNSYAIIGTSATTSWTRFSKTFTIPSDAFGLRLEHYPDVAQPSGVTVTMTGMQLELGSVATSFRRNSNSRQGELAACQRYYFRVFAESNPYTVYATGSAVNTTKGDFYLPLPVHLRATPSTVDYLNLACQSNYGNVAAVSEITVGTDSTRTLAHLSATSTILVQNSFTRLLSNNTTNSYIGISAEL